ncbi:nuclear transport factor 2 family protein [Amycolatopsis magusensis]|uniref:nuclear transport factor 2 family protein n=1 Tax=Amycolatopsis magusensis TaxID=882444 RepID=UPI003C2DEF3D
MTIELVERWATAFNNRDVDAYIACYTEDLIFEDVALHRNFHGRTELAAFFTEWDAASPQSRVDVDRVLPTETGAVVTWTGRGVLSGHFPHLPPTAVPGSRIDLRAISVLDVDPDGLIVRHTDYYDVFTLLQQIGVIAA